MPLKEMYPQKIYLDNNATTSLDPRVIETMRSFLSPIPLNPSSSHYFGRRARGWMTESRDRIAHALQVPSEQLIFTSSGTEALNLLIRGTYRGGGILSSNVEHPSVQETLMQLQAPVTFLPAGLWGAIRPSQIEEAITPATRLIVLSAANNITGVKIDLASIAEIAQKYDIPLIIDGVQLLGKELFQIHPGITGMAFSAHKIHGPTGIGLACARNCLVAEITGGGQERGRRAGTENLLGIVGFAKAIELLHTELPAAMWKMETLSNRFAIGLKKIFPQMVIHGEGPRICNTLHIGFPGIDGEGLLIHLDMEGIAASHGSACASGGIEISPTLLNMGIANSLARASIRFSLSRQTTEEEIDRTLQTLQNYFLHCPIDRQL